MSHNCPLEGISESAHEWEERESRENDILMEESEEEMKEKEEEV